MPHDIEENGWSVFSMEGELKRMLGNVEGAHKWNIIRDNEKFEVRPSPRTVLPPILPLLVRSSPLFLPQVCDSYPQFLAVPKTFPPTLLRAAVQFRERSRFPALSWIHPKTHATITRCSQPAAGGFNARRSEQDEALIRVRLLALPSHSFSTTYSFPQQIFEANPSHAVGEQKILDARPFTNAVANRAKGSSSFSFLVAACSHPPLNVC